MGSSLTRLFPRPHPRRIPLPRHRSFSPDTTLSSLSTREWTECRHWFLHSARPLHENRTKNSPITPFPHSTHAYILGARWPLPLRPGVSRYAVLAGLGAGCPIPELRAQHHGQLQAWRPLRTREAEGPRSFLRRWSVWAAAPGNGPARVNRERAASLGGAEVGREPVRRHAVVGEVTSRAGRMGAALAMPPSRFVTLISASVLRPPAGL